MSSLLLVGGFGMIVSGVVFFMFADMNDNLKVIANEYRHIARKREVAEQEERARKIAEEMKGTGTLRNI